MQPRSLNICAKQPECHMRMFFSISQLLTRGLTRCAPAGRSLAFGGKCVTATDAGPTTSWPTCNVAGEMDDGRKGVDMR